MIYLHYSLLLIMKHILLIEDTIDIGESIQMYLEACDYTVYRAKNIHDAKQVLTAQAIDCAVIDRMLPDGSGIELCQIIKYQYSHIPCILETAKFQIEDKIEGFESGVDDYIVKPYDLRELEVRIANLIERFNKTIERNYNKIVF
jgi:two-component system, OmpR family, response regulator